MRCEIHSCNAEKKQVIIICQPVICKKFTLECIRMHLARKNCGTQNNGSAVCAPSCDLRLWFLHVHFVCNYCVMSCDSVNASRSTHCSFYAMQISRPRSAARKLLIWSDGSWDYLTSELLGFKIFLSTNNIKYQRFLRMLLTVSTKPCNHRQHESYLASFSIWNLNCVSIEKWDW